MTQHVAWPSIDNFYNLRRSIVQHDDMWLHNCSDIAYASKVKLHGTNAGIQIDPDGVVTAFSRTQIITPQQDNYGFASWVDSKQEYFAKLADDKPFVIYGEWCGPGIQNRVGISKIPNRIFAVFGIRSLNDDHFESRAFVLESMLSSIPDLHVLPYFGSTIIIPWQGSKDDINEILNRINSQVCEIEREDPWVKSIFGISGPGEGLVFYPVGCSYKEFASLAFKAKGEAHAVVARSKPAQYDPTVTTSAKEFAELVVTLPRLQQAARFEADGELVFEMSRLGVFLKWISCDIIKECVAELEASKLDRSVAMSECVSKARNWYKAEAKKI